MKRALAVLLALVAVTALAALPGSGAISFSMIQTEFGGSNPISFSEYYRNGGLVPTNGTTGSIATSGAINVNTFHGAAATGGPTLSASGSAGTFLSQVGYINGGAGTFTPTTTSDGKTVEAWYQQTLTGNSFVEVSGFGADPGQNGWATNFVINGIASKSAASANVYAYSSGTASWRWNTTTWGFVSGAGFTAVIN